VKNSDTREETRHSTHLTRLRFVLLVVGFALIFLLQPRASGATNARPTRVLIVDSFGRDVVPFNAASMAFRNTIGGKASFGIPGQLLEITALVYEWGKRPRWAISEAGLPAASVVQSQQPTFWQQYKWLIILVLALCIFEAALIDILLRERRCRRLAQQTLEERVRFEQLVSDLSTTFINQPPERMEAQIIEALGQVASFLRFDIAALSVFTGRGTEGRVAYIWRAEKVPEFPSDLTDKDFPWSARELFAGRDVCLRSLEMLPLAARADRATYEKYHVRSSYSVPMMGGGKVIGVLGISAVFEEREISPELLQRQRLLAEIFANALTRKTAEESRRESEQNFRSLLETTAAVPWQADAESWVFTYVGPQAVRLLGYPLEQWYQKDFWVSHLHPDDKEFAVNTCSAFSKSAADFEFEYRMIDSSGETVWVHDIVKCEHRDGKPVELRGFMLDISERKRAEEALRESEERMGLAASTTGLGLWMWDATRDESWVTPEGRRLFGWAESEPVNLERFIRTLYPDDREPAREAVLRSLQNGGDYVAEYRVVLSGGVIRWIATRGRVEFDGKDHPVRMRGVSMDVTERKRAEETLEKQRAFLRQVIDIDPNFIFAKDREGRFTLVNQAVADAYGTTVEDLIGKTDADFNPNSEEVEFFHRMDLEVMDTLKERFIPEERLTDAQGKTRWLQTVKRPILDRDGSAAQVLGASTDITQRKETELELQRQRGELAHLTRVSTMGELAASLAHELNQPLTAILSNTQAAQRFLAAEPPDVEELREILKDIVQDDSRASEVIQRIRALVKKEELAFASLDLASVVRDVAALVHSDAILQGTRILVEIKSGLPLVRGDKVQLQQVVLNLLLNAFDAMKDCPAHEREVKVQAETVGVGFLRLAVRDHGTGLSGDKLDKIFQPFYTTKRDGLGMGLSISRSIIDAHDGRLWAENNLDRGATFYCTLPVSDAGRGASAE
jgi:two-component system, LuxR family, sensor kinase FixL